MNIRKLKDQLILHEGIRLQPYFCTAYKLTIGVGRNLDDNGISLDEAHFMLDNDIFAARLDLLKIFPDFEAWPERAQHAIIDMRFNLGPGGFRSFKKMIEAAKQHNWQAVAQEMMQSKWFNQVGLRGSNLVEMMQEVADD